MRDEEGSSVVARPENVDTETRGNIIAEILTRDISFASNRQLSNLSRLF